MNKKATNLSKAKAVRRSCNKFLYGHYPVTPKEYFSEMQEVTSNKQGRDQYGKGDTLNSFEQYVAKMFGHESSLFFQSGTMAQLIAMRIWSEEKEILKVGFHPTSHLELHEHLAYKELHGLESILIGEQDKIIDLPSLKKLEIVPAVVLLELPQRELGGQVPTWKDLKSQVEYLHSKDVLVHMDGARVWEVSSYYQKSYKEIGQLFDSIYISFYKGIGAVSGAALISNKDFIKKSRIWQRRHGGNLITSFPTSLSAEHNLKKRIRKFPDYYQRALELASTLSEINGIRIQPTIPQANMFHMFIEGDREILAQKAIDISLKNKVWGLNHFQQTSENLCKLEWYVGDATMYVPVSLIKEMITDLTQ
mgnify:CR=1 FL=1